MRRQIAVAVAAMTLPACSMIPYYTEAKAIADTGIATAVKDRREFNDRKLQLNLAALCDSSIGAVNRHQDIDVREFIDRLCGGDGEGISPGRLNQMLRTLDKLNPAGS
ncbi:MAG: hypothetical protein C0484_17105 [Rhodospirillum sp.]|jgi:hypothetical protein|nr:hypothetical protein [Rhodospirillum sp.]